MCNCDNSKASNGLEGVWSCCTQMIDFIYPQVSQDFLSICLLSSFGIEWVSFCVSQQTNPPSGAPEIKGQSEPGSSTHTRHHVVCVCVCVDIKHLFKLYS